MHCIDYCLEISSLKAEPEVGIVQVIDLGTVLRGKTRRKQNRAGEDSHPRMSSQQAFGFNPISHKSSSTSQLVPPGGKGLVFRVCVSASHWLKFS